MDGSFDDIIRHILSRFDIGEDPPLPGRQQPPPLDETMGPNWKGDRQGPPLPSSGTIPRMMQGMDNVQSQMQDSDIDRRVMSEESAGGKFDPAILAAIRALPPEQQQEIMGMPNPQTYVPRR